MQADKAFDPGQRVFTFHAERSAMREVLLVEDNRDDETFSLRAISLAGVSCRVTVIRNGAEVLGYLPGLARNGAPNLIILDYVLPFMDGLQVLKAMRQYPDYRYVPVVMFSDTHSDETLRECYEEGASSCVRKPFDARQYVDTLSKVVRYWLRISEAYARRQETSVHLEFGT